uniref:V-type proton ATPase subunit S1 n=1 Tax=Jaculus jaculus TaxID=51337 RepID=A0A8C5KUB9_JACJA
MGRKTLYSFSLLFLCIGFSLTLGQLFFRKNVSSQTSSKEGAMKNQQNNGDMKPIQNFTTIPITQVPNYNLSTERWNAFSHHNPVKFSRDGVPCILFWTKRITIKFKNQTWLDLTDEAFGEKATVDVGGSNCSEESAMLSVKFGDAKSTKDLAIRFLLTNHNKLPSQSWFSLQQVEVILNNSVRATFHATGVGAPSSYSYRCRRVSSLRRSARPLLAGAEGAPRAWELSFTDFQIQGFAVPEARFAPARDCAAPASRAVLMGLAGCLLLLLALASALHGLVYLRYLERRYELIPPPARGPADKERFELRSQPVRGIYV